MYAEFAGFRSLNVNDGAQVIGSAEGGVTELEFKPAPHRPQLALSFMFIIDLMFRLAIVNDKLTIWFRS
jgi:hypothetical protein